MWCQESKEVPLNCHLNEKAEEDRKEAKAAAAWFNAPTAVNRCQETKPKDLPAEYLSLNPNLPKSYGKKERILLRGLTPNGIAYPARSTEAS
jgi:hypothetical protein